MSCLITSGITSSICKGSQPGIDKVYIANFDEVTGYTETNDTVTAIGMEVGKTFFEFNLNTLSSTYTEEYQTSDENGVAYWQQTLVTVFGKMDATKRNLLKSLGQGKFRIIIKDNNGNYFFQGIDKGVRMSAGTVQTGKSGTDLSGASPSFLSNELYPAPLVDSSIIAGLL